MAGLIVALDLPSSEKALQLVDMLGEDVQRYKVGSPLFTRVGPRLIEELHQRGKSVFLDLKFHDIPNSVARAVESAAELQVEMLTLHASGGLDMLAAAREAAGDDGPRLLGVTLLTSFTAADVEQVWAKDLRSLREEVSRLAGLAADAGLQGVVASALEVEVLKRKHGAGFMVVTPGIRPAGDLEGDQVRIATPAAAVRNGSDFVVVGRPILAAPDPVAATAAILAELKEALEAIV